MTNEIERAVPDTSVLISGVFSGLIEKGIVKGEIIIPEFVIEELRSQASRGKEIGFKGLEELKKIREFSAIIYTSDMVQALVGEAEGIKVQYFKPYKEGKTIAIESLLTEDTMS